MYLPHVVFVFYSNECLSHRKSVEKGKDSFYFTKLLSQYVFQGTDGDRECEFTCLGPEVVISLSLTFCSLNLKPVKCCLLIKLQRVVREENLDKGELSAGGPDTLRHRTKLT